MGGEQNWPYADPPKRKIWPEAQFPLGPKVSLDQPADRAQWLRQRDPLEIPRAVETLLPLLTQAKARRLSTPTTRSSSRAFRGPRD
jgi:hypothetical protein